MSKFESVRIGNIGCVVTGKTPKTDIHENYGHDYMFIGPTDLHKHFFIKDSEKMVSELGLNSIKGSILDGVSVLVGCIGWDMGNVGIIEKKCVTNQQINSITQIKEKYNPLYVYYWLKTKKEFLFQQASVTRTPILNKTTFSNIHINIPKEKTEQDKIVNLLTALDKKIELNNHINTELEAMAKTLYDYWFVQFDFPDANGKPYKSSGGKMVYNEVLKREIPERWRVSALAEWIDSDKTGDWGKESEQGNYTLQVDCIRGADINGINGIGKATPPNRYILKKNQWKILSPFDFVVEISGGSPIQSTGRMAFITDEILARFDNPLICSNFCKAISLKDNQYFYNFIYKWNNIYHNDILFGWEGKTSGIKNLLFDSFVTKYQVSVPPKELAKQFYDFAAPLQKKKQVLLKENAKLESLREWLLPMLMNGQITVT